MLVRERVVQAVRGALGGEDAPIHVEVPKEPRFGDFSCNVALLRGGGRALAEALRDRLPPDEAFAEVRVEGPGFLNFWLSPAGVAAVLRQSPSPEDVARLRDLPRSAPDAARVQWAHARAAGLLRMGADQGRVPGSPVLEPREIVRALEALPWLVRRAALRREPRLVAAYAGDLAERFHSWYEGHPLLAGDPALVEGRLALARGVQDALAACCEIMGVNAPERM